MKEHRKHTSKAFNEQQGNKTAGRKSADETDSSLKSEDVKNAHASGIGALGRSDENQIEKLSYGETGNEEDVY